MVTLMAIVVIVVVLFFLIVTAVMVFLTIHEFFPGFPGIKRKKFKSKNECFYEPNHRVYEPINNSKQKNKNT